MMQVENEYGYYGDDNAYMQHLVKAYREKGIDVPLFTSDGPEKHLLMDGTVDGCFSTLNFGSNVEEKFKAHDELFPDQPKMCMEMWNGWFDEWGDEKHHTTSVNDYAQTVDDMLKRGSVNMFMFIGGTNFEFTSGALHFHKFMPHVTSYDYDALLSECGDVTDKYYAIREVIQKHTKQQLPEVPKNREKKAYGKVSAESCVDLFDCLDHLSNQVKIEVPKSMEDLGFGFGYVLYRTKLNRKYDNAELYFESIGDRAHIYVNDSYYDTVYVNNPPYKARFTAEAGDVLSILCENMGRTNFGAKMMRKKGIVGRCLINEKVHFSWEAFHLPMDNIGKIPFVKLTSNSKTKGRMFYKFIFLVNDTPCDTFLRTDNFTKGFAVVNGFNLGRYWDIGPQKTLYVPSALLKKGFNELIIFENDDLKGDAVVEFVDTPDL